MADLTMAIGLIINKEGKGKFVWADGKTYDGEWKDGKQHGIGNYYGGSGDTKKGEWKNGKRVKWVPS